MFIARVWKGAVIGALLSGAAPLAAAPKAGAETQFAKAACQARQDQQQAERIALGLFDTPEVREARDAAAKNGARPSDR